MNISINERELMALNYNNILAFLSSRYFTHIYANVLAATLKEDTEDVYEFISNLVSWEYLIIGELLEFKSVVDKPVFKLNLERVFSMIISFGSFDSEFLLDKNWKINIKAMFDYIHELVDTQLSYNLDYDEIFKKDRNWISLVVKWWKYWFIGKDPDWKIKEIIPLIYDNEIRFDDNGVGIVICDGKYGILRYVDSIIMESIPLKYDYISEFVNDVARTKLGNKIWAIKFVNWRLIEII